MIFHLVFFFFLKVSTSSNCKTIMNYCVPFFAGSAVLLLDGNLWYNNWITMTRQSSSCSLINFDNLALSMNSMIWKNPSSNLSFELSHYNLQSSGFGLSFYIWQNNSGHAADLQFFKSFQISYLAVINGKGIEVVRFQKSDLQGMTASGGRNVYKWSSISPTISTSSQDDYVSSVSYRALNIIWSVSDKSLQSTTTTSLNNITVTVSLATSALLNNITMDVIIFKLSSVKFTLDSYNYFFEALIVNNASSTLSLIRAEQNYGSNAFAFTGVISGVLLSDFQFGYDVTDPSLKVTDYQSNYTAIDKTIISKVSQAPNSFLLFRFFKNSSSFCPPATPFLYIGNQMCCDVCPTNLSSANNLCTRCNSSSYLSSSKTCIKCSTTEGPACLRCTEFGCLQCDPSTQTQLSQGVCKACTSSQFFQSSQKKCLNCSNSYSYCLSCTSTQCTGCNASQRSYLSSGSCVKCPSDQIYISLNQECKSCGSQISKCSGCLNDVCISCEVQYYLSSPTYCELCSSTIPHCKECSSSTSCSKCDSSQQAYLSNGNCLLCASNQYFNYSEQKCVDCSIYGSGCSKCNSISCTECDSSLRKYLSFGACIYCSTNEYFNSSLQGCRLCSQGDANCQECSSQSICTKCSLSSQKYLSHSGQCTSCLVDQYFDQGNLNCSLCSTLFQNCSECSDSECFYCEIGSGQGIVNGSCQYCLTNEYINNSRCHSCEYHSLQCLQCNLVHCTKCDEQLGFHLINSQCTTCHSNQFYDANDVQCRLCPSGCEGCLDSTYCTSCSPGYLLETSICTIISLFTFRFQVYYHNQEYNTVNAYLFFNGSIDLIKENYQFKFYLNENKIDAQLEFMAENNTLKSILLFKQSALNTKVRVNLFNKTNSNLMEKIEDQITVPKLELISPFEQNFISVFQTTFNTISQNQGSIFTTFSFTSLGCYFVNILWSIQIASFYIFTPIKKPKVLELFLNSTMALQSVSLLPYNIPNPYQESTMQIQSQNNLYAEYEIDLFFMRANFEEFISLGIFVVLYLVLFFIFRRMPCNNFLINFIKRRTVQNVYMNLSMNFYNILISLAFSASASLTSRKASSIQSVRNYLAASLGLCFCFFFLIIHSYLLYIFKQNSELNTEECYVGIKNDKQLSQIMLFFFVLSQLIIPIVIVLFHPIFGLTILIVLQIFNINMMLRAPIIKIRTNLYLRIIHEFLYILFNLLFIILYIIQRYFPLISFDRLTQIGYGSILVLLLTLLCEMLEALIEVICDIYRAIQLLFHKNRIQQIDNSRGSFYRTKRKQKSTLDQLESNIQLQLQNKSKYELNREIYKKRKKNRGFILKKQQKFNSQIQNIQHLHFKKPNTHINKKQKQKQTKTQSSQHVDKSEQFTISQERQQIKRSVRRILNNANFGIPEIKQQIPRRKDEKGREKKTCKRIEDFQSPYQYLSSYRKQRMKKGQQMMSRSIGGNLLWEVQKGYFRNQQF